MLSTNLAPGTTVGGEYVIERKLASGGMGSVYIARQLTTHKLRALKMLPSLEGADAKAHDRFIREATAGGRINSEHIVEVVGAGVDADLGYLPWIAMELLEGADLYQFAEGKAIASEHAVMILQQLFSAVIAAHRAGVVHRDLKPDNVFLKATGFAAMPFVVKVLDFGIAKLVDSAKTSTKTRSMGTPGWLAPEQFKSNEVGKTADVWALGLLTFFTLTGRRFWLTEYEDDVPVDALYVEMLVDAIPAASARAAHHGCGHCLPARFDAWFAKCLNREASGRFPDAEAAWQALMPLLSVEPTPAAVRGTVASSPALQYMQFHTQPQAPNLTSVVTAPAEFNTHQGLTKGRTVSSNVQGLVPSDASRSRSSKGKANLLTTAVTGGVFMAVAVGLGVWWLMGDKPESDEVNTAEQEVLPVPTPSVMTDLRELLSAQNSEDMVLVEGAVAASSEGLKQVPAYWLDRYEVSVGQYEKCVVAGVCSSEVDKVNVPGLEAWSSYCTYPKRTDNQDLAMNCVSWAQAEAYCKYRFARLPTEQEWYGASFDARQEGYPWGLEGPKPGQVNLCDRECAKTLVSSGLSGNKEPYIHGQAYEDKHVGVAPISAYPEDKTLRGVVGMGGNVMEWTSREDEKDNALVRGGAGLRTVRSISIPVRGIG